MKFLRWITYLVIVLCFTSVLAQAATCGAMVEQALANVQGDCNATGRNQACYGYVSLQATPRQGVANFNFTKAGDTVNVTDIDSLSLSRLDTTNKTWGIALMKLQANLPDTLPGENVTFLLFGDVQVTNAADAITPSIPLIAKSNINVRTSPSTNAQIADSVAQGDIVTADGRTYDSTWLRVEPPDISTKGWIRADLVTPMGDVSDLDVIDPSQQATSFTPMQAFYFQTGITKTSCEQAPQDGILIQTPKGAGEINLRANDVDIQLGSTAFFQAQPSGNMTVSVVEGEGHITSQGKTVDVPAGTQTTVPMDANLHASGQPTDPQPYDAALVQPLPVQVLPLQITVVLPAVATAEATEAAAPAATATPSAGRAASGQAYSAQTIMEFGGATISGSVCAIDTPFSLTLALPSDSIVIQFVPSDAAKGAYSFKFTLADGEAGVSSGTYTITDPAADGSRTLTIDGNEVHTFLGDTNTIPIHYSIGLKPSASC